MSSLYGQDGDGEALFGKGSNKDRNHVEYIECERHSVHALVEIEDAHERKDGRKVAVESKDQRKEVGQFKLPGCALASKGRAAPKRKTWRRNCLSVARRLWYTWASGMNRLMALAF